jgi:hypothetical protein
MIIKARLYPFLVIELPTVRVVDFTFAAATDSTTY